IASNTNNLAKKEDLLALQRLQEEFAAELATLRGRVDALEARTSELEANQFSTTTKLSGHVGTYIGDVFGKNADPENNSTFSYELNLNFLTSFTGKDSLVIALIAANNQTFNTATDYPSGRLSGATDETRLTFPTGVADGEIALGFLQYSFPVGDKLTVYLDAFSSNGILSAPITTLGSSSRGYVSLYGRIVALSAPVALQSGIGVKWNISPWLSLDVKAGSEFGAPNNPSIGLFNGGNAISFRPVISLGRLKMTAFYVHSYSPEFGINTFVGGNAAKVIGAGPVVANSYTGAMFYRVTPNIEVGGSVSYATARTLGSGTRGDARVWDYNINFTFYDLGKKGNVGGILLGMQPRLASTSNGNLAAAIGLPSGQRSDRNAGLHFETFYAHRIGDNITITPAFIWLTAPNHDKRNPDVFMGVIRTTFDF
ncbi:MAG TPA: iron uptake porin, partial [Kamptonema sp.]|nr:iron uptake porin [Kamptonema sp.]